MSVSTPTLCVEARAPVEPLVHAVPLRVEPRIDQAAAIPIFSREWKIAPMVAADLERVLRAASFRDAMIETIVGRVHLDRASGEGRIFADSMLLDRFTPQERMRWWLILAAHSDNRSYRWPLAFSGHQMARLESGRAHEAAERLRRWSVPYGGRRIFADLFALEEAFGHPEVRAEFFQTMLGCEVSVASAALPVPETEAGWIAYWHLYGRHRALGPFVDAVSAVAGLDRIDLGHILPRLPRALLNSYPPEFGSRAEPSVEAGVACARFFDLEPGGAEVMNDGFSAWLRSHCDELPSGSRVTYGDLIVYGDIDRNDWPYAAVYLADGFVFARRPTLLGPWTIMPGTEVARLNPRLGVNPPRTFRRRSAEMPVAVESDPRRTERRDSLRETQFRDLPAGPWGSLKTCEVVLAPGRDILNTLPTPAAEPVWMFRGITPEQLRAIAAEVTEDPATRAELERLFVAVRGERQGVVVVRPSLSLVLRTPVDFRNRAFGHLIHGDSASAYAQQVLIPTRQPAGEWFGEGTLSSRARELVLSLTYARGSALAISDFGALFHELADGAEREATLRAVFRTPAVVMVLERPRAEDAASLAGYWRIDQRKGVRLLLESFAQSDELQRLDVLHLLPPLPREFMNLYAVQRSDLAQASCYWTAMNFDATAYDPRFLVPPSSSQRHLRAVRERIASGYEPASDEVLGLGDLIVYRRIGDASDITHVCSHVAAGVVFTKNGHGYSAPWCLMRLEDVDAVYLRPGEVERFTYKRRTGRSW